MDFADVISKLGPKYLNIQNVVKHGKNGDIYDAIEKLTDHEYRVINIPLDDDNFSPNNDFVESGTSIQNTGDLFFEAWDPRLMRIDGFTATKENGAKAFVPFASDTAASAFYDLVFTIEKGIDEMAVAESKPKQEEGNNVSTTNAEEKTPDILSETGESITKTERTWRATKDVKATVEHSGNSYGVASLMNPYTLTKLCGSLAVGDAKSGKFENYVYDIRDQRRFYGDVIDTNTLDVLSVNNPTTTNIITWSNRDHWGRTPYSFLDFVFCKWWNKIPNNRLITFRKYHAPVYDNLQYSNMFNTDGSPNTNTTFAPMATVVTYFGDDTGNTLSNFFSFTAGTKWKEIKADIHQVSGDSGSDPRAVIDDMFTGGGGFPSGEALPIKNIISGANFITGKMFSFGKFVGLLSPDGYNINHDQKYFDKVTLANVDPSDQLYANRIKGPVNRIDSTKARDAGITFEQKFNLTCQYVARPIGGINTKAVMLDILSNCMEMASANAVFWGGGYRFNIHPQMYPFKNTAFKNRIMDDLYAGRIFGKNGALAHTIEGVKKLGTTDKNGNDTGSFDWSNITGKMGEFLGETLGALGEMLNSVSNMIFGNNSGLGDWLKGAGNEVSEGSADKGAKKLNALGKNLNQMWRSQVVQNSIMPHVEGMRALLTGEPVGNWHLTIGNPLNPIMVIGNLICTDMKVEVGEELGPDDFPLELKVTYTIEHGMPRDKDGIQSMFNRGNGKIYSLPDYIKASSDYETKVDNYTGGRDFYLPSYMNSMAMLNKGGGGGFQSYRIPQGTTPNMNAHTDNTVIAKFTPVAIDVAVSNITDKGTSFLNANPNSRVVIRGNAAVRKLMN